MRNRMDVGLRICLLTAATAGLLSQSLTAYGQNKNVVYSNTKKTTKPIAKATPSPQSGTVPQGTASSQTAGNGKSEVQRQLELLYEKDGREMPEMNVQPMTPTGKASQVVPATPPIEEDLGPSTVQPTQLSFGNRGGKSSRTKAASSRGYSESDEDESLDEAPEKPPVRQNPIKGFFKKLNPFANKKSTSEPPIPPDSLNSIPAVPPSSGNESPKSQGLRSNPYRYAPSGSKSSAKQGSNPQKLGSKPVLLPVPDDAEPIPPVPPPPTSTFFSDAADLPPLPNQSSPALESDEFEFPAATDDVSLPELPLDSSPRELNFDASSTRPSPDRQNPFSRLPLPEATTESTNDEGVAKLAPPQQAESEEEAASAPLEEDPFAVREKEFVEPPLEDSTPPPAPLAVPTFDDSKPALNSPSDGEGSLGSRRDAGLLDPADSYLEKMERIRARFGMKGLKGFCPVTLKDQRELRDAKPEYNSNYRGQKFHFSTPEARDRFNENPAFYAPAAYGADVVALGRDKDVIEGTLDYAAWYKGRLYLFGSQANYDTFVKTPAKYAKPVGIE